MRTFCRKTYLFFFFAVLAFLLQGGNKRPERQTVLSPHEELLSRQIGIDREVLKIVKEFASGNFHRMSGYDQNGYQIMVDGFTVQVPEEKSDRILAALRHRLANKKHMAFLVEINEAIKSDRIGVLKGTDQYEILRIMQTNGDDYDITNADIIERLKEWESKYPFAIIGAENDWVEIEFRSVPENLHAFIEEINDFCPDAVGQEEGGIDALMKSIASTLRLVLWWER